MTAVELHAGARILLPQGPAVVKAVERHGAQVTTALGEQELIRWDRLECRSLLPDGIQATHSALQPWWDSLDPPARSEARIRLEVVLELLTGYRDRLHPNSPTTASRSIRSAMATASASRSACGQ